MRELADDEIASIGGGDEATVEPAPEPGVVGSILRWVDGLIRDLGGGPPPPPPPPLDGGGIRG